MILAMGRCKAANVQLKPIAFSWALMGISR